MKKGLLILGTALAVLVLAVSAWGCGSFSSGSGSDVNQSNISQQNNGIWVTGVGKVTMTPDLAVVSLGVQAQASTVANAQQQAAKAMADVIAALKGNGVADKDIATQYYNITPVYSYDRDTGKQVLEGYSVSNTVTVKIRTVGNAGVVIDAVAAAGGDYTRINSIALTVDKPEVYNEQARENAMNDAANRAKQLAKLSGVKLGKATYINESLNSSSRTIYFDSGIKAAPSVPTTPISPGETEITLTVQVVYSIS
ncbi:MAG: DUF541 domain-containing protein [Dehalococcoidia bacterium]|nr:MAG: DUF541 domain-containing protein [Dehalococcoidia bacterium]